MQAHKIHQKPPIALVLHEFMLLNCRAAAVTGEKKNEPTPGASASRDGSEMPEAGVLLVPLVSTAGVWLVD